MKPSGISKAVRQELAGWDLEAHVVNRREVTVALRQLFDDDGAIASNPRNTSGLGR